MKAPLTFIRWRSGPTGFRLAAAEREIAALQARCREYAQQLEARAEEIRALTDAALLAAGARAIFNPALNAVPHPAAPAWSPTRHFHSWRQEQELATARDYAAALRQAGGAGPVARETPQQ